MSTVNSGLMPHDLDDLRELREKLLDLLAEVGAQIEDLEGREALAYERELRLDYRQSVL